MLSYNGAVCGEYDNLGNPCLYRGKRLSWSHARQLDSIGDITYKYNSNGVRIAKTANGVTTKFYLDGTAILAQEVGNRLMLFTRGIDGLNGFTLDGAEYFYKKNVQGDIIAIMDALGAEIVRYVYDAWGNHKTSVLTNGEYKQISEAHNSAYVEIAQLNPYRYRSYYYDIETGLYYLNSRYYDSEVGRFINADNVSEVEPNDINGLNLYAYCLDNPVMLVDDNGNKPKWWQWLLFGIGAVLVVAAAVVLTVASAGAATGLIGAIAVGAAKGALIGAAVGSVVGVAGGAIYSATTGADMGESILSGFLIGFGIGAVVGAVIGGTVGGVQYGSFASPQKLESHFMKHSNEFGNLFKTSKEYGKGAKYVIRNGQKISYTYKGKITTGYIKFLGTNGGANYAFVGLKGMRTATFGVRTVKDLIKLGIALFLL